jgi:rhamnogalacturonyl hydrolase YesR
VVLGRDVRLDIDDTDRTAVAVIGNGDPTDEVWLDRSWDGGKSWESKIGDTRIPRGARSATTTQWNLDNGRASSVVRACGKAGNRRQVACTGWHMSRALPKAGLPWDRGAVDALMSLYDRRTGLWRGTGWWNSANALTSLIDYMSATGDTRYRWVLANTFDRERSAKGGSFTNGYLDDTGWWALAWIRAYDLTHRQRYLRTAQVDVDHMWTYRDDVCGGGVWWSAARKYKNAITNELFIKASAELHIRIRGDREYLRKSLATWRWFKQSGMVNGRHLVNDGLDTGSCRNNHGTSWTYNQGVVLGGLVDLARATHDRRYLRQARVLADASTGASSLHVDGVLTEPCEASDCGADGPSFKGIYVRNLGELARATSSTSYRAYLRRDAEAAHDRDRTPYDQYGVHWPGPTGPITGATQQSAVDLMVAALH